MRSGLLFVLTLHTRNYFWKFCMMLYIHFLEFLNIRNENSLLILSSVIKDHVQPIPVSRAACSHLTAGVVGLNPAEGKAVPLVVVCCTGSRF